MTDERTGNTEADADLLAFGREFETITNALDSAIAQKCDIADDLLLKLGLIETAIISTPARSIQGFCVKARAACWARLGDLNPDDEATTDKRMALSIVRDLIRQCHPALEHPDALKKLAEHD